MTGILMTTGKDNETADRLNTIEVTLAAHGEMLAAHGEMLAAHGEKLAEHDERFRHLEAGVDQILAMQSDMLRILQWLLLRLGGPEGNGRNDRSS